MKEMSVNETTKTIPQMRSYSRDDIDVINKTFISNNDINNFDYNYNQSMYKIKNLSPNCFPAKFDLKDKNQMLQFDEKIKFKDRVATFSFKNESTQEFISTEISKRENALENKEIIHDKHKLKSASTANTTASNNAISSDYVTFPFRELPEIPQYKFIKRSTFLHLLGAHHDFVKVKDAKKTFRGRFCTIGGERYSSDMNLEHLQNLAREEGNGLNSTVVELKSIDFICNRNSNAGNKQKIAFKSFDLNQFHGDNCIAIKTIRLISRSLDRLHWRHSQSVDISSPDPEFKVCYLGNVLTGWAKGEGCVEKQLSTLWSNYTQNKKSNAIMCLKVCASGLKGTTREHGLTEYWSNRITYCCMPKNYPRIFCWIYRHEGRKLKHELRCHAILCSKQKIVHKICHTLKANLECALREFKREKILKQNARLSLANSVNEYPSLPRRKILLSVGSNNYRPPIERSKSAPKLMAIEEAIGEEGEEIEDTNEPEMRTCCQKDSLYPSMTLGRRHCRRGHSIRRTGKVRPLNFNVQNNTISQKSNTKNEDKIYIMKKENEKQPQNDCSSDDFDDANTILKHNNYDANVLLKRELMPYFDSQLCKQASKSCTEVTLKNLIEEENEAVILLPTINSNPNAHPDADYQISEMRRITPIPKVDQEYALLTNLKRTNGLCGDAEDNYLSVCSGGNVYFHNTNMVNICYKNSMNKLTHLSLNTHEGINSLETDSTNISEPSVQQHLQ